MRNFILLSTALSLIVATIACTGCDKSSKKQPQRTIDTLTGGFIYKPSAWKDAPCTLITDEEVAQVLGPKFTTGNYRVNTAPEGGYCMRQWDRPDIKEREASNQQKGTDYMLRSNLIINAVDFGDTTVSIDRFRAIIAQNAESKRWATDVPGVGDAALWSDDNYTLLFRRDRYLFYLNLDIEDEPRANLEKAKEVAFVMMKKIDAAAAKEQLQ